MRFLLIIPVVAVALGVAGYAACTAGGYDPHVHDMVVAGIIGTIGAVAGLAPVVFLKDLSKGAVTQAGLAGTVGQMMLTLLLAVAAVLSHLARPDVPFTAWLLAFYWTTLVAVVFALARLIRGAKDEPRKPGAPSTAAPTSTHD